MSGDGHPSPEERLAAAVDWLVRVPVEKRVTATCSLLREMWGLKPLDAVEAIKRANAIRYGYQHEGGENATS